MTSGTTLTMSAAKITISLDEGLLNRVDQLVQAHIFPSRSQAIQVAVQEKIARMDKARLAQECAKLDPAEEQALAEEGLAASESDARLCRSPGRRWSASA